jgi:DNA polymerase III alpha subunit (gram-positive type)
MTALLWVDIESTGLNPVLNDVIQIACVPQINGQLLEEFNGFCQPLNYDAVDQGAVDTHGITVDKMKTFQPQSRALEKFISYLKSFNTRFTLAGYNVDFDRKFIGAMFQKHGKNKEYRELFSNNIHDTMVRAKLLKKKKLITSAALGSVAQYLGVDLTNAHDAIHDIRATITIDQKLSELIGEESVRNYFCPTSRYLKHQHSIYTQSSRSMILQLPPSHG